MVSPDIFAVSDDTGTAVVRMAEIPPDREAEVRDAYDACPTGAILVAPE
jgi:ferredoxin